MKKRRPRYTRAFEIYRRGPSAASLCFLTKEGVAVTAIGGTTRSKFTESDWLRKRGNLKFAFVCLGVETSGSVGDRFK